MMTKTLQTLTDEWIKERPFLKELGQFHLAIESILESIPQEKKEWPALHAAKEEFKRGIPLFKCESFQMPALDAAIEYFQALTNLSESEKAPAPFKEHCLKLQEALAGDKDLAEMIIRAVIKDEHQKLSAAFEKHQLNEGVTRFLAWTAIARAVRPYLPEIMEWEEKQGWHKEYCPTCGALPNMAQLKRSSKGRRRHLVCGCCKTQWVYKRIICPYCGNEDQEQLEIIEIEGEDDIRVDVCNSCKGYIKVYTNQGEEEIALADWSTIHFDILIKEKGFLKMGTHLFDV